ncbi:hypothetical protein Bca4012_027339 [Brassica carinata]
MATMKIPMTVPSPRVDAEQLFKAFKGRGCDASVIINILAHRNATQRALIEQEYETKFSDDLRKRLQSELHGHLKVLLAYLNTTRYEGPEIDDKIVEDDARTLKKAVARKHKSDDQTLIQIFTDRSRTHLVALRSTYRSMFGKELGKAIRDETRGNFEHVLLTILQCAENSSFYFAKALRKSMKGLGTDDTALIRMVVTRAEVDMHYIVSEYRKRYKKTLYNAVQSDTSGHYKTFLLSLLGPNV